MSAVDISLAARQVTRGNIMRLLKPYTTVIALALIWIASQFLISGGDFITPRNMTNLLTQMSILGIAATGMFMVIVTGQIDLSVASVAVLCSTVAGILHVYLGWNAWLAILVALIVGVLIGAMQGFAVAYMKVPAFIVTLAGMLLWRGVHLVLTNGESIGPMGPTFELIGASYITFATATAISIGGAVIYVVLAAVAVARRKRQGLPTRVRSTVLGAVAVLTMAAILVAYVFSFRGLPMPAMIMFLMFLVVTFITVDTRFGRHLFAIGGNRDAATLAGINVDRKIFFTFVFAAFVYAVAGLVLAGRMGAAAPNMASLLEMEVIASCVIGGTSLLGGQGSVAGAILGALVMASLDNGLALNTQLSPYWKYMVKGWILMAAVWFDITTSRIKS
jgi:D-xylose transport system permease protein